MMFILRHIERQDFIKQNEKPLPNSVDRGLYK